MTGGRFVLTAMANAGRLAENCPSLTLIKMLPKVPTFELVGVPDRRPVPVLNVAQLGRFAMLYVNVLPSGSAPTGWNAYWAPTSALVGAVPDIDGGEFVAPILPNRTLEKFAVARVPSR